MTFTEVAFELADERLPLCRATRAPSTAHGVYRVTDQGHSTRRHRAHLTFCAPPAAGADLMRDLRLARPDATVELVHQTDDETCLAIDAPLEESTTGLPAIGPALARHGIQPVIDPIILRDGRAMVRMVIPRTVEAQEVLRALQDLQRSSGSADLKIVRIAAYAPGSHVGMARRSLPPEQEILLALANSMGYYETPKNVTLEQIARAVGLSISPVHKRLKAAEETIVTQHVAHATRDLPRRRFRNAPRLEASSPWEVQLRVRGDFGPVNVLKDVPEACASVHVLSGHTSLLVVMAPHDAQAKLLSGIEGRPEVADITLVDRSSTHLAARLTTRERGPLSHSWWNEAWGYDAALRAVVYEGGEAHVRGLLTRPFTAERFDERVRDCARFAGWTEWEVESLRDLSTDRPPTVWPDPLTPRQIEVLRVAHALGYYKTPRGCTLEHVAKTLGVSANAVHKNLVLAESKLIAAYLAAGL